MNIVDNTAKSPISYRVRQRKPEEITTIVLHAMGFAGWKLSNPMWYKVRAHYVVKLDGTVLMNHHPLTRMRYGSSIANSYAVSVEMEGNPINENGKAFKPEKYGVHPPTHEQVASVRALMAALCTEYPSIQYVSAHKHIQAYKNCPGFQRGIECGEWAMENLGLHEAPVLKAGMMLPEAWRGTPSM